MTPNIKKLTSTEAYELGRKIGSGEGHDKSSPETRERLSILETSQKNIMEEIQELKVMIKEMRCEIKEVLETKANKWVENVMLWGCLALGGGIVAFITWFISSGVALRLL